MSAFEKLPREVRDLIYGYCLIHDGEIIPYPNIVERGQIEDHGGTPARRCFGRQGIECNVKMDIRSCAGIRYAEDWPSVALLGVSKGIQEEAANVLFGKNVWRLSFVEHWEMGEEKDLWYSYIGHFRHISTHMSLTDAADLPWSIDRTRADGKSKGWNRTQMTNAIHEANLRCLANAFEWKQELLDQMPLKSLIFNVENLLCPHGCCRKRVLRSLCRKMGQDGPWYRLAVDGKEGRSCDATTYFVHLDIEAKRKVNVKVVGLEDDLEKEIFMEHWGLEVK